MLTPRELTPEAKCEVERQAERIAALGDAWEPTAGNLLALIAEVMDVDREARRALQAKGIESARNRGVKMGRPRMSIPREFEEVYHAWKSGEYSSNAASKKLKTSSSTFLRWAKQWEQRTDSEERNTCSDGFGNLSKKVGFFTLVRQCTPKRYFCGC